MALISQGANVNCIYENHNTPLHIALSDGNTTIVDLLLKNGANVDAITDNGYNALMGACIRNNREIVELLLKYNSNVNQKSKNGWTPLMLSSRNITLNHVFFQHNKIGVAIFRILEQNNLYSLKNEPIEIVKLLIKAGSDVNHKNKEKNTPLGVAITSCNTDIVRFLLDCNANVEEPTDFGDTLLIEASGYSLTKYRDWIINWLSWLLNFKEDKTDLIYKIKEDLQKNYGNKPQQEQIELFNSEMLKIVTLLVQHSANIKAKNNRGATAIVAASDGGNSKIVDLLLKSGCDINEIFDADMSLLFIAAQKGNIEVIKVLLQNGVDIDSPLDDGETALMTAVWYGHVELVKFLVKNGANIDAKKITPYHKEGENMLGWAAYKFKKEKDNRYLEIFNILHNAGAK